MNKVYECQDCNSLVHIGQKGAYVNYCDCGSDDWEQVKEIKLEEIMTEQDFNQWKRLTRLFLLNVSAIKLYYELDRLVYEVANDQWTDFKLPEYKEKPVEFKINPRAKKISEKISILDVAKKYGIEVKRNKSPCPFHADKDPSLVFYPKTNSWFCFGCRKGGDVINFIQNMMESNSNNGEGGEL